VQFHPEYDMETAESVTRGKDLDEERRAAVLSGITPEAYAEACEAKTLFANFTTFVREHREGEAARESGDADASAADTAGD
jgi:GMP synthase (glutamine-hydrolysing)